MEQALAAAGRELSRGQLVILPTDTLYALSCRASDAAALGRLREAKGRDDSKPLPLVVADAAQLLLVAGPLSDAAARLAGRLWPGPLTLVLEARGLPDAVTRGTGSVAVRVPAHDFLRNLCRLEGPLVSTSANRSGRDAPLTCAEAVAEVGAAVALAIDGGAGRAEPSTIVDVRGPEPLLLRAGATAWEAVLRALRP